MLYLIGSKNAPSRGMDRHGENAANGAGDQRDA